MNWVQLRNFCLFSSRKKLNGNLYKLAKKFTKYVYKISVIFVVVARDVTITVLFTSLSSPSPNFVINVTLSGQP